MDLVVSLALGVGLAAACGFRVFVPFLVMSLAGLGGYLPLEGDFAWIASYPALAVFGAATLAEVLAYYVPWVDNLLDTIATPAAVIAGLVATAAVLGDLPDVLQWTLAVIAGGGTAGVVQASTVAARGTSSAATGGLGNAVVATIENASSAAMSILAIVLPVVAMFIAVVLILYLVRFARRRRRSPGF